LIVVVVVTESGALVQVPVGLEPHPQMRRCLQEPRQPQRGLSGDAALPQPWPLPPKRDAVLIVHSDAVPGRVVALQLQHWPGMVILSRGGGA
jgi:hypothetical protein